jgi:hypothetical protein
MSVAHGAASMVAKSSTGVNAISSSIHLLPKQGTTQTISFSPQADAVSRTAGGTLGQEAASYGAIAMTVLYS